MKTKLLFDLCRAWGGGDIPEGYIVAIDQDGVMIRVKDFSLERGGCFLLHINDEDFPLYLKRGGISSLGNNVFANQEKEVFLFTQDEWAEYLLS